MRLTLMATVAAMALQAGQIEGPDAKSLIVYFENSVAPKDEFLAKNLADKMFAPAGVRIVWRVGSPSAKKIVAERPIVVRFARNTPVADHPGALAFAVPYEGVHIKIFYDRVKTGAPRVTPVVLAHVLVHEITHILQGIARHSDSGLMKARWTAQDYTEMAWQPMPLTSTDIDLIRTGLAARAAGLQCTR